MTKMTRKDALYYAIGWYECLDENDMFCDKNESEKDHEAANILFEMIEQIDEQTPHQ